MVAVASIHHPAILLAAILLAILELAVIASLVYHGVLLIAGAARPRRPASPNGPTPHLAVVVPAHNEETVITATVAAARSQRYPADRLHVYVVADYCSDTTAARARQAGAICLERNDGPRGRKAYALQWGLAQLLADDLALDAFVVIDADSQLEPTFAATMASHLQSGRTVLQGQHRIANPRDSAFTGLADVDMRTNNLLRNQAKGALGLSGRLMGDAMCFARTIIETFGWPTETITEDREFGLYLGLRGIRTFYVPEAISRGQAAGRWQDASKQRLRWYTGMRQVRLARLGTLWSAAWRGNLVALDGLLELALPSISLSALLSVMAAAIQVTLPGWPWLLPTALVLTVGILWILFPVAALLAAKAPWASFRALLWGPVYLVWRVWIGLRARLGRAKGEWVRTRRREEAQGRTGES